MAINKNEFPKVYKHLGEWIKKKSQLHNQPAEVLQAVPVENMVDIIFNSDGRVLQDYLMEHYIYLGVWPVEDIATSAILWKWKVIGAAPTTESSCEKKEEAENKMLTEGLRRLETKL